MVENEDLLESGLHQTSDTGNQYYNNDGTNTGHRNMYELLPPIGAIHGRRLIELGVDACDCGQIDDGIPAEGLPDHGHYHGRHEKLFIRQKSDRLKAEALDHSVDNSRIHGKNTRQDTAKNYP